MKRLPVLLATLVFAVSPASAAGPKAASINMCTDQLLLALADDDQILGLSPYARDRTLSFHAARAAKFPVLSGLAEDILPLKPDLVLTATFVKPATRALLRRTGHRIEEFDAAQTIADVRRQIVRAGDLLGHPDRAARAIADIDAALARAKAAAVGAPWRVLPLERRGWVPGMNSLTTEMLDAVGLRNPGGPAAGPIGGRLSMEAIVALKPDRLLLSGPDDRAEDQGSAFLRHEALARIAPPAHRMVVPENMTVCGGPMLGEAFDRLVQEIRRSPQR